MVELLGCSLFFEEMLCDMSGKNVLEQDLKTEGNKTTGNENDNSVVRCINNDGILEYPAAYLVVKFKGRKTS